MMEGVATTAGHAATTGEFVNIPIGWQTDAVEITLIDDAVVRVAAAQPADVVYEIWPIPEVKPIVVAKLTE